MVQDPARNVAKRQHPAAKATLLAGENVLFPDNNSP